MIWACSCQWPWTSWGDRKYRTAKKTSNSGAWKLQDRAKCRRSTTAFRTVLSFSRSTYYLVSQFPVLRFQHRGLKWTPRPARLAFDNICVNCTSYLWGLLSVCLCGLCVCLYVCLSRFTDCARSLSSSTLVFAVFVGLCSASVSFETHRKFMFSSYSNHHHCV